MKKSIFIAIALTLAFASYVYGQGGIGTGVMTFKHQAKTPSAPSASTYTKFYFDSSGILKTLNSSGAAAPIGASTGTFTGAVTGLSFTATDGTQSSAVTGSSITAVRDDGSRYNWIAYNTVDPTLTGYNGYYWKNAGTLTYFLVANGLNFGYTFPATRRDYVYPDASGTFALTTDLTAGTLNWATTGTILGAIKVQTAGSTAGAGAHAYSPAAALMYGTLITIDDSDSITTVNLPDYQAAAAADHVKLGASVCILNLQAKATVIAPSEDDKIRTNNGTLNAGAATVTGPATIGAFTCFVLTDSASDVGHWTQMGINGAWPVTP